MIAATPGDQVFLNMWQHRVCVTKTIVFEFCSKTGQVYPQFLACSIVLTNNLRDSSNCLTMRVKSKIEAIMNISSLRSSSFKTSVNNFLIDKNLFNQSIG